MYICVFVISLMVVPVIDAKFSLKNITDSVSTKINRVGATFNRGVNGMTRKTGVWGSHSYIGFKTINNLFQRSSGEMQLLMIKIITDHLHMMVDGYPEIETDDPKILEKKQYDVQNALMFIELPVTEKEKLYAFTCQDNAVKSFIASVAGKEFLQLLYKAVPVYKPCKYVGALVKHDEKEHLMFLDQEIEGINASLEKIGQEKYQYDLRQKEYEEKRGPIQISMEIIDNRYRELAEQCAIIEEDIILKDVEKEKEKKKLEEYQWHMKELGKEYDKYNQEALKIEEASERLDEEFLKDDEVQKLNLEKKEANDTKMMMPQYILQANLDSYFKPVMRLLSFWFLDCMNFIAKGDELVKTQQELLLEIGKKQGMMGHSYAPLWKSLYGDTISAVVNSFVRKIFYEKNIKELVETQDQISSFKGSEFSFQDKKLYVNGKILKVLKKFDCGAKEIKEISLATVLEIADEKIQKKVELGSEAFFLEKYKDNEKLYVIKNNWQQKDIRDKIIESLSKQEKIQLIIADYISDDYRKKFAENLIKFVDRKYRKQVLVIHPDKNPDKTEKELQNLTKELQNLNEAKSMIIETINFIKNKDYLNPEYEKRLKIFNSDKDTCKQLSPVVQDELEKFRTMLRVEEEKIEKNTFLLMRFGEIFNERLHDNGCIEQKVKEGLKKTEKRKKRMKKNDEKDQRRYPHDITQSGLPWHKEKKLAKKFGQNINNNTQQCKKPKDFTESEQGDRNFK